MALNLTTLFTRLGRNIKSLNDLNVTRLTDLQARADLTAGEYTTTDRDLIGSLYTQLSSAQSSLNAWAIYQRTLAQATVVAMVNEDEAQANKSLNTALQAVIADMISGSATVKANTVGAVVTPGGSNTGNGVVVASMTSNLGVALEYAFAETISGVVSKDSQGGATSGRESIAFAGQFAISDPLSWLYPAGSGASKTLRAVSGSSFNGSGTNNYLSNGDMEVFTVANIPDGWTIDTGTAGTTVLKSTGTFYDGAASLNIVGNGSELTKIHTEFGTDTSSSLKAETTYAVNFWCKNDSNPSAGILRVALVDGSGTVINDVAGNANSFTVDLTTLGTSFVPQNGFFRTPRVMPSACRLEFKITTAITSTHNLFIDRVSFAQPTAFYTGGPLLAAFSGSTPWIVDDSFSVAISNDYGGAIQSGTDRMLNLRSQGLYLPSSGSPTISDGLVA